MSYIVKQKTDTIIENIKKFNLNGFFKRTVKMRKITILFLFLIIQFSIAGESSKNISNYEFPNIIIFYVDDLGWADTSVLMMNNEKESASDFNQTPSLERLASIGTKFSNAYSPAPTCTPSRKSIS